MKITIEGDTPKEIAECLAQLTQKTTVNVQLDTKQFEDWINETFTDVVDNFKEFSKWLDTKAGNKKLDTFEEFMGKHCS